MDEKRMKQFGFKIINGCLFHSQAHFDTLEKIHTLPMREDDIVISSYPRSGTHWVGSMVHLILHSDDLHAANNVHVHDRFTWLDIPKQMLSGEIGLKDVNKQHGNFQFDTFTSLPSPRIFVSHLGYPFMPRGITDGTCKLVVVMRNPKSVLCSISHMFKSFQGGAEVSEADFRTLDNILDDNLTQQNDRFVYGTWFNHLSGFWAQKDHLKVLFIKYEDMVNDLAESVTKTAEFLEKDLTEAEKDNIVEHLTFNKMRNNPKTGKVFETIKERSGHDNSAGHMRKGVIDDWKDNLTVSQSERIDSFLQDKIQKLGLEFQYE
ncbi:unnamed protein product [Owenia fusiformis]|uniref:Uncharacterized protein n=1 Tax=Owenia fusiformis TaxID=6347 RepID=A0A8J1YCY3_OWEFU|nr:unnamed protein product [Owenia fusiformis]